MTFFRAVLLFTAAFLVSCHAVIESDAHRDQAVENRSIEILAFGDSGYHYDYLNKKYYREPYTSVQAFSEYSRQDWRKKGKPLAEFTLPEVEFHAPSGSFVPKSGLDAVARAMTKNCEQRRCDFAVMLGDNIYPDGATLGADGKDDEARFRDMFSIPFGALGKGSPDFKIYTTLGNHDWHTSRAGAMVQVAFMGRDNNFYMDGLFYSVKPPAAGGQLELFVVDTEMILTTTPVKRALLNEDGSEKEHSEYKAPRASALPQTPEEENMVAWLGKALAESTAKWKIVVGHHPIWSAGGGKFEQARALRRLIRPMLCEYADAYLAGHEHTLEVYADTCSDLGAAREKDLVQVVSGAAGKQRGVHSPYMQQQDNHYPQRKMLHAIGMVWGFCRVSLENDDIIVESFVTEADGRTERVFRHRF